MGDADRHRSRGGATPATTSYGSRSAMNPFPQMSDPDPSDYTYRDRSLPPEPLCTRLSDVLALVESRLGAALLDATGRTELHSVADRIPALLSSFWGLEIRIGDPAPRAESPGAADAAPLAPQCSAHPRDAPRHGRPARPSCGSPVRSARTLVPALPDCVRLEPAQRLAGLTPQGRRVRRSCSVYLRQTSKASFGMVNTSFPNGQVSTKSGQLQKYHPGFPGRFDDIAATTTFCRSFLPWYNTEHRHAGIAMLTPHDVHYGRASQILEQRKRTLRHAWSRHPERFVNASPSLLHKRSGSTRRPRLRRHGLLSKSQPSVSQCR